MTTKFETITLSLPAHWLCPILYGDTTGLDRQDLRAFARWLDDIVTDIGHGTMPMVGTISDYPCFARYHDAAEYGVLACDCYDVDLLVQPAREDA